MPEQDVNNQVVPPVQPDGEQVATPPVAEPSEPQATETPTPQEGETPEVQEEQRVPYDRFKSVVDEKNFYKQQAESLLQRPPQQPQPPQPQQDPYAHLAPEEQVFYRNQEAMMKRVAKETMAESNKQTQGQIQAAQQEFARIKVNEFRRDHPDVKAGSEDEEAIAKLIQMGYQPNHAYWSHMGPKGVQQANQTAQRQVKRQMQVKKQANVETGRSIPPSSNIPATDETYEQTLDKELAKEGL